MVEGVIFDLGNTLMYFNGDWDDVTARGVEALESFMAGRGLRLGQSFRGDFVAARRDGRERSARTDVEYIAAAALQESLARHGYGRIAPALVSEALERFFAPEEEHWVAYPDALETVRRLRRRGLRVGLISNATDDGFIQRVTERAGLRELMQPVLSSAALPWRKPDPRIFRRLLDDWQLDPATVVMVGDWPGTDVLGAHRAGIPAVLIDQRWPEPPHIDGGIPDPQLLEPDAVIRQLGELLPVLERLDGSTAGVERDHRSPMDRAELREEQ